LEAAKSVVVVVNKWDLVPDKDSSTMATHAQAVKDRLRFLDYVPVVFVSALTRQRVDKMLAVALHVASERNMRIPTSELNRILRTAVVSHPATGRQGRPLRFFYATQARVAPPVIVVFVNDRELIHFSYERYLENSVRSVYSFEGTPIKFEFRNRRQREEKAERAHDFA
jgi:GTP-binding protein